MSEYMRVRDGAGSTFAGCVGEVVAVREQPEHQRRTGKARVRRGAYRIWSLAFDDWPGHPLWFTDDEVEAPAPSGTP